MTPWYVTYAFTLILLYISCVIKKYVIGEQQ